MSSYHASATASQRISLQQFLDEHKSNISMNLFDGQIIVQHTHDPQHILSQFKIFQREFSQSQEPESLRTCWNRKRSPEHWRQLLSTNCATYALHACLPEPLKQVAIQSHEFMPNTWINLRGTPMGKSDGLDFYLKKYFQMVPTPHACDASHAGLLVVFGKWGASMGFSHLHVGYIRRVTEEGTPIVRSKMGALGVVEMPLKQLQTAYHADDYALYQIKPKFK